MECNKEEAIRAKEIAEKKMENKDFVGARKVAFKARQLYPDLDNISQMILVCDVHCSAENKIFGNEKDWYSILQIEPTADDAFIKKQYRKFALLLHPDKNKFSGAADAFKLIGEAQRVLSDREKRMLHDSKCKATGRFTTSNRASQQASRPSNVVKQPWAGNSVMNNVTSPFTGFNQQRQQAQQQTQPGVFNNRPTFWTVCPFCSVRYQFYKDVLNKCLLCPSCGNKFTSSEMNSQGPTPGTNWSQSGFPQKKEVQNQGPQSTFENPTSKVKIHVNACAENPTKDSFVKASKPNEKSADVDVKINKGQPEKPKSCGKMNGKRRKPEAESSGSCHTESSTDSEEDIIIDAGKNFGSYGDQYPRRSTRSKQHVSYDESLSEDEDKKNPSKRAKCSASLKAEEQEIEHALSKEEACNINQAAGLGAVMEEDEKELKQKGSSYEKIFPNGEKETKKANEKATASEDDKKSSEATFVSLSNLKSNGVTEPEFYDIPDPDFNDFDKDRKEECFMVGQLWAIYDTLDAMPRFYARIRKVLSPGFKLRITWLEPDPDDEDEINWVDEELPVSCGKYKHGISQNTEDHQMFSHLVYWEKGRKRDTYKIYPRKGETWALFKNWDIKWYVDPDSKRKYEFEFVEVLSDYAEGVGVSVVYLDKVKGFASLFCRRIGEEMDSVLVPPKEIFRFSHMIPSFQMTGEERKDVPKGSFELDPASLPTNLEGIAIPENLNLEEEKIHPDDLCCKSTADKVEPMTQSEGHASMSQADPKTRLDSYCNNSANFTEVHCAEPASTPEAFEIPEPEFYNFDADKSPEKLQVGQIWALYSKEDGLPKYYGQIVKIDSLPEFKLYVRWLVACSSEKDIIQWHDKNMPICCGRFFVRKSKLHEYTSSKHFSHKLKAESLEKKDVYAIFPRKGEVWALYKNWNAGIRYSDMGNCEYNIVEVLEEKDSWIMVLALELVNGFKSKSVFKAQMQGQSCVTMKIPRAELLKFSHQIPAFRLTEEQGGSLRGFWELDPAALSVLVFT